MGGRIAPEALVGPHTTLQGSDLTVAQEADGSYTINGTSHIICGNVQTANATVYIIDGVLLPPMAPASPGAMASPAASMAPVARRSREPDRRGCDGPRSSSSPASDLL